jgi:hypothetical protein
VPVAVAAPRRAPFVAPGVQHRGQLLLHRLLDGHADVLVNQLAQGHPLRLLRALPVSGTVLHGAFLRWPPWQAAGWWLDNPPEECATSLFPHQSGHHRSFLKHEL